VKDKVVLVTGGGRGIGRMFAEGFVKNGCKVFISSRSKSACDKTAEELTAMGPGICISAPGDLSSVAGLRALVETLTTQHKVDKLHVLINNSGNAWGEPLEKFTEKGWDRVMDLNLKSVFFLTQMLLPQLKAAATKDDPARIINIGSVAGIHPQPFPTFSYDASKAALHHLTKKLAFELGSSFITVNAIAPGFVPSKMSSQLLTYDSMETYGATVPMGRVGKPQDMAGAALFLSSTAGSWVTGVTIPVDGGSLVKARL